MDEPVTEETAEYPSSPSPGRRRLKRALTLGAPLLAAGAIGAGIAVGIGAAIGFGGDTTIVTAGAATTEAVPVASTPPADDAADDQGADSATTDDSLTVAEIYRRAAPGVVRVISSAQFAQGDQFAPEDSQPFGQGSGFVIDEEGHIVTNYHVVQGADSVEVEFSGRDPVEATVVGVDPSTDLAVLDVDLPAAALTPIPLGNSSSVEVGDEVVAIGNPFGLDRTVTKGIVSALHREIRAPNGFQIEDVIQTDAAINRGNSGGPLLNARGEVIGVNSQIETGGIAQGNVGVGFAVPINTVREIAGQLIETGKVERAFLGISMQAITPELTERFNLPTGEGVLIASVVPDGPAQEAGLRGGDREEIVNGESYALGGDIIVGFEGKTIRTPEELRELVLSMRPGDVVEIEINRDGIEQTIQVELGRQPTTPTG